MSDPTLLVVFAAPAGDASVIEHVNEEFTSVCPVTGHPDFGRVVVRYQPSKVCVELKSLKLYCQAYRNQGIYYEAVTGQMRDHLQSLMKPVWLQVITEWKGRGGIHSRILASAGDVPVEWRRG